jgi:hypothetical protein
MPTTEASTVEARLELNLEERLGRGTTFGEDHVILALRSRFVDQLKT